MITILGPTATGKTILAAHLAYHLDGEIISADSRQVYRGMNIGTGKDLDEFTVNDKVIPYYLIDIADAGYEYNIYEYQKDFYNVYNDITKRHKTPIFCGGSGMYIEAVLKGYKLSDAPVNKELRNDLENKTNEELIEILSRDRSLHNTTDTNDRTRLIRAVEIVQQSVKDNVKDNELSGIQSIIFGIYFDRQIIRARITERLKKRLEAGMIDEVKSLLTQNVSAEKLKYYGLEYKFITQHLLGELNYDDMFQKLNSAIHQFAKRQMTWFRRMEKQGFQINWIDGGLSLKEKINVVLGTLQSQRY